MSYLVLARKYRPQNFDELVGQEVLVTTLSNAIKADRLHHAYILTGIRGVGKTTTARIIAKVLNCSNRQGTQACGECDNCKAIAASKHQDVIEMDAASRTGVDDVREIIDSIAYAPVQAKYKIYIIDEVHMLSNSAFNALLKTLEEPPAHVKFIFATTEIKKVPITILSRCQRFDLRRLKEEEIVSHLKNILSKENISAEENALTMISKASEGSVRDSLSLLDQAIANNEGNAEIKMDVVEKMLGFIDKTKILELFETLLSGDFPNCEKIFSQIFATSSDISFLLQNLIELNYDITAVKLLNGRKISGYSEFQQQKIGEIAQKTPLSSLTRIWQMLNKGISEVNLAFSAKMTFEMLMVRICHLVSLPNLRESLNGAVENSSIANSVNSSSVNLNQQDQGSEDSLVDEILNNFSGSEIVNSN